MKIQKTVGAAVTSLGLVVGLAGFAGATSGSIDTTGPHSYNSVKHHTTQTVKVQNNNHLNVRNTNNQRATTGSAVTADNNHAGDASTGSASNDNSFSADVSVDNSGSSAGLLSDSVGNIGGGDASISDTGPHSVNKVSSTSTNKVTVENNNNLSVSNSNTQTARSGDARVTDNTHGGSATTGDAMNTNSSSISFDVSN